MQEKKEKRGRKKGTGVICMLFVTAFLSFLPVLDKRVVAEEADLPEVTSIPEATQAPKATGIPEPVVSTPKATKTPKPSSMPKATKTPKPSSTPKATKSPKPVKTKKEMVAEKKKVFAKIMDEGKFLIRAKRLGSSKVKLIWKDADATFSYRVYSKASGKKEKYIKTVKSGFCTVTGLKKTKQYKLYVRVYYQWKGTSGGKRVQKNIYLGTSLPLVVSTGGTHFMNTKKLAVKMEKVTLYKKQMHSVRTRIWLNGNKTVYGRPKLYYHSSDKSVAIVDGSGLVTAKKKGTAVIFVMAPNGVYDKLYIKVKG